jgi:arabinogalactan oligomer/maltooligosaccharide transport system permease protein
MVFKNRYRSNINIKNYNLKKFKKTKLKIHQLDSKPLALMEIIYLFLTYIILICWALVILFPVVSLVVASFNTFNPRYVSIAPMKFGLENFKYLFNSPRSYYGH